MKRDAPRQTRIRLDTPVTYLKGVGPARAEALKRLGVVTAGDLLYHIPHRYEDASTIATIASLEPGMQGTVVGRVEGLDEEQPARTSEAATTAPAAASTRPRRRLGREERITKGSLT